MKWNDVSHILTCDTSSSRGGDLFPSGYPQPLPCLTPLMDGGCSCVRPVDCAFHVGEYGYLAHIRWHASQKGGQLLLYIFHEGCGSWGPAPHFHYLPILVACQGQCTCSARAQRVSVNPVEWDASCLVLKHPCCKFDGESYVVVCDVSQANFIPVGA